MLKAIRKRLNKKGFTLVELIVVIAVLGILATVAVPKITGIREKAEDAAIDANTKMLRNAASMYLAENGNPDETITWNEDDTDDSAADDDKWEDYLDGWPTGFTLTIDDDGDIDITN